MARSKVTGLALGFRLLADRTRLAMLKMLRTGPKNVTALCAGVGRKQPLVSHHLGLLRVGGLVVAKRTGKSVIYTLDAENLKELAVAVKKLTPKE
jgi:ArsR family transcriptional regulator